MHQIRSVYIKNYKNFKDTLIGIDQISLINLIIGRNNTGKSSLLDVFDYLTDVELFKKHNQLFDEIVIGYELDKEIIERVFHKNTSDGKIGNHYAFGEKLIGKIFYVEIRVEKQSFGGKSKYIGVASKSISKDFREDLSTYWDRLANAIGNPFTRVSFFRLAADRNIVPEKENSELNLDSDGTGATNLVHKYINWSTLDSKMIEKKLLETLNQIITPDAHFTDIVVQQIDKNNEIYWEIFLEEETKGRVSLSNSGSGLKTIILVLLNLFVVLDVKKLAPSQAIFALEELENNLHPSLQRNLFTFIKRWAVQNDSIIYLTTHSNIPINLFSSDLNSQILHLRRNDNLLSINTLNGYKDSMQLLDDLEVRASDIFQTNGVIWVEGPSDRIYINKWIKVFSNETLVEGIHYQIIFYGGRLLSHFQLHEQVEESSLINLLLTNRNSAIVIDSDKRYRNQPINDTKKRIQEEFHKHDSFCWITKGKEIENYIPLSSLSNRYDIKLSTSLDHFQLFDELLDSIRPGEGKKFLRNKIKFAQEISDTFYLQDLESTLDLKDKMNILIEEIKSWN